MIRHVILRLLKSIKAAENYFNSMQDNGLKSMLYLKNKSKKRPKLSNNKNKSPSLKINKRLSQLLKDKTKSTE
jgi:hypothetical protein